MKRWERKLKSNEQKGKVGIQRDRLKENKRLELHRETKRDETTHVHRTRNGSLKNPNWERGGALGGSDIIHVAIRLSEQMRSKNLTFLSTFPRFQSFIFIKHLKCSYHFDNYCLISPDLLGSLHGFFCAGLIGSGLG